MQIIRTSFDESIRLRDESIFTCAAHKLGVRGNFEEGCPEGRLSIRGTYINGFCDTEEIKYNEKLYGFTSDKQTICNLPDGQGIEVYANNQKLCCWSKKVSEYSYVLDMSEGIVKRKFIYDTGKGKIKLTFNRFTSFTRQGLFVINLDIESIDYDGEIEIKSTLNGDVKNFTNTKDPRVASGSGKMLKVNVADTINHQNKELQFIQTETINSGRMLNTYAYINMNGYEFSYDKDEHLLIASLKLNIKSLETKTLTKYCFYSEVNDNDEKEEIINAINVGYKELRKEQVSYVSDFWKKSRVLIDSDDIKQEHLDLCLYVMLSSAGKDGKTSIAAKGLSGEGYEGHYFWDCETYIYPFFLNTNKDIAKALLEYRYSKLDDARKHARNLGHVNGALYPWRTITGSECSSYFPSGSAQYHINADIARAFIQYWRSSKDYEYLPKICEVLLETSRLWIDLGHYDNDGLFKIDCVTGPDEYTCMVNNNYYTNVGAKNNLENAYKLINLLKNTKDFELFKRNTDVSEEELNEFLNAANHMYLPYDEELNIIKQDDSFLNKKKVDLSSFNKDEFPLLLNYHPLYLYRHQICKQADAVLADYLYDGLSASTSMNTFEYYNEVTTHDSSLSKCIFGNIAAKLGDLDRAKKYFIETLNTDVCDQKGNTKDGLHMANMGGCYDMIVGGFGGLRLDDNGLSLFPMLPNGIRKYSFTINYLNSNINVLVDNSGTTLSLDSDEQIEISVYGQKIVVNRNKQTVNRITKGVIFDLDGVITDTAKYHFEAWKKIANELNVDFNESRNEEFKGVSRKTCLEKLLDWGNIKMPINQFEETLVRKNDYYKELLNNLTPSDILPGVVDTISHLHQKGIKVSLFSVSKNTDAILERLKIRDIFDVIVSGNDIKNSKPHYEGYLLAADRMGVEPRLCTMVEDSSSGIQGAKALSMKTIAIMKENVANADFCVDSTDKLIDVIDKV